MADTATEKPVQQSTVTVEPAEPKADRMAEKLAALKERTAKGESIFDTGMETSGTGDVPPPEMDEVEGEVEAPAEEAQETEVEAEAPALPEGYTRDEDGRIRGPDGKFVSAERLAELEAGGEAVGDEAAAEGATEPEDPDEEVVDSEEGEEPFVLQLPGRREGEPDLEIPMEGLTQEEQEAFARLRNGYSRGEEARTQLERAEQLRSEAEDFQVQLQADPIGFFTSRVPKEVRADLARHLLTDDEVYNDVVEDVAAWDRDPNVKARRVAELERDRLKQRDEAERAQHQMRTARQDAQQINAAIEGAIAQLPQDKAPQFKRLAVRDLREHALSTGATRMTVEEARGVLKETLRLFGLTADALAAPNGGTPTTNGASPAQDPPVPTARPKGPAEERLVRRVSTPGDGERFAEKAKAKQRATATSPSGGAAPTAAPLKKGDTVEDRVKLLKDRMKSGGGFRSLLSGG